jgi:hypothetical protein
VSFTVKDQEAARNEREFRHACAIAARDALKDAAAAAVKIRRDVIKAIDVLEGESTATQRPYAELLLEVHGIEHSLAARAAELEVMARETGAGL